MSNYGGRMSGKDSIGNDKNTNLDWCRMKKEVFEVKIFVTLKLVEHYLNNKREK